MLWTSDPPEMAALEADLCAPPGARPAEQTYWRALRAAMGGFGITRVADITGLDVIGWPVAQAVRPGARSNIVTQGKAATRTGAAIGAVLECLEMAAGEDLSRFAALRCAAPRDWAHLAPGADWPTSDTAGLRALRLPDLTWTAIPRDLVSTDFARGAAAEAAPLLRHSIGLGAGAGLGAALYHGLLECIEADARLRFGGRGQRVLLDPDNAVYGPVLRAVQARGLRAALWRLPAAADVTVVEASVMEAPGASALPLPASGFAARAAPDLAILAALSEAVQARLAVISGAREDITQRFYAQDIPARDLDAAWTQHAETPLAVGLSQVPEEPPSVVSLAEQVGPVFAVILHWDPALPLAIGRIVAPRLAADPLVLEAAS